MKYMTYISSHWKQSKDLIFLKKSKGINLNFETIFQLNRGRTQETFVLMKTSWRRLEDVFRFHLQKMSSRYLQDVFIKTIIIALLIAFQKTSSRRLQDVFKTSSKCLQDVFKTLNKFYWKFYKDLKNTRTDNSDNIKKIIKKGNGKKNHVPEKWRSVAYNYLQKAKDKYLVPQVKTHEKTQDPASKTLGGAFQTFEHPINFILKFVLNDFHKTRVAVVNIIS